MNETKSREEIELLKSWTNFINEDGSMSIKIDSYMNLIYTVKSLVNLCITAGWDIEEKGTQCEPLDIINTLELIKKLLPFDEFEVLERLNKNLKSL